jgi:hypothetical protein
MKGKQAMTEIEYLAELQALNLERAVARNLLASTNDSAMATNALQWEFDTRTEWLRGELFTRFLNAPMSYERI